MVVLGTPLSYEVPGLVFEKSGIKMELKGDAFKNEDYLEFRFSCNGQLARVNVKI